MSRYFSLLVCLLWACGPSETPAPAATQGGEQVAAAPAADEDETESAAPEEASLIDPVAASPDVFKVILDGERMRVLEATWKPKQRDNLHGHPALVAYAVTPIFGIGHEGDDQRFSIRIPQGRFFHQPAVASHAFENSSTEVAKMVIFELKPEASGVRLPKGAAADPLVASPDIYKQISVDAQVRVLLGTWKPGQKDALHAHPACAVYAITDVRGKLHSDDGKTTDVVLKRGTALFEDPIKAHSFENLAATEAQLLIIEQRK